MEETAQLVPPINSLEKAGGESRVTRSVRIIFPSSGDEQDILGSNVESFERNGFRVTYRKPKSEPLLPFLSASLRYRVDELTSSLLDPETDVLVCARGGFGAGDLLPHIPWESLRQATPKCIVGFSDISALHSAFFAKLGWAGIHGPMPATEYWTEDGEDVDQLFKLLHDQEHQGGKLRVKPLSPTATVSGWLFGGCLSVLCSLIGTPYFPKLDGAILFLEDVGEHPGRLLRYVNQLSLSGVIARTNAVMLGSLGDEDVFLPVKKEIARRLPLPVFSSQDFGHCFPNFPLTIGSKAEIDGQTLRWGTK
ncbi:MAG: LD-carboxypeptidase [Deltaproteobacteria bacterium]|nr:LD-carboxypeptidase [Deltaproteobacteria bacterium]